MNLNFLFFYIFRFFLAGVDEFRLCTFLRLVIVFPVVVLREDLLCIRLENERNLLDNFLGTFS